MTMESNCQLLAVLVELGCSLADHICLKKNSLFTICNIKCTLDTIIGILSGSVPKLTLKMFT